MALAPLHAAFGLRAIIASSYQAVSGSGAQGIIELEEQVKAITIGQPFTPKVYPRQIAFNVIPQVDVFTDNGYTKEELKMLHEGRKILASTRRSLSCTCVRVPVYRAHSVAINAQFERPVTLEAARAAFQAFPGIRLVDNPANNEYPDAAALRRTGRLRGRSHPARLCLRQRPGPVGGGDQLLKGAALNAVQIAELL